MWWSLRLCIEVGPHLDQPELCLANKPGFPRKLDKTNIENIIILFSLIVHKDAH